MDVKGKKITVVGLGVSGRAAAELLERKGAQVYVTDSSSSADIKNAADSLSKKGIVVETGAHTKEFIAGSTLLIVSPGVMDSSEALKMARKDSIPAIGEIELASYFCRGPIIAVTGTNGKTTTTTLIGLILKAAGKKAVVCGNIGEAFCEKADQISHNQFAVVEVSSFQLKRIKSFKPKAAVITNISQNHFDWHLDFDEYFGSKKNIYKNQKIDDYTILNYDDHNIRGLEYETHGQVYFFSTYNQVRGTYSNGRNLILNTASRKEDICSTDKIKLKGLHNISNILCACACSSLLGADIEAMRDVITSFQGLPHRFQHVADINGIRFIDDSKSTTVDACRAAISSCSGKIILIAGGRDKGSDFTAVRELIKAKVRAVVLIGEARQKIRDAFKETVDLYDADSMDMAVDIARRIAHKHDIVLLSPMCASFDMYKDYKQRGDAFCAAVGRLKSLSGRGL